MSSPAIAIVHYSAPPVIGGVEAVMEAHARLLLEARYKVTIVAGRGAVEALPPGVNLELVPELDSQHPEIVSQSETLEQGQVPAGFGTMVDRLEAALKPLLGDQSAVMVHNVFTKHFNLPATAALFRLLDQGVIERNIAWCHDFTWTSPSSRSKVHPGYPWDLLRTYRPDTIYVVVSQERQRDLAKLLGRPLPEIRVVYNGVFAHELLGLSDEGLALVERLNLLESDLILLMPVRVTQAKNIEYALQVVGAIQAAGLSPKLILTGPPDPHDDKSMAYYAQLQALRASLGVEHAMRFVFESGPDPKQPYLIDPTVVADLYRASDVLFMPSHREGFAMPILEAGLLGLTTFCTRVPAAVEIGGDDVFLFEPGASPESTALRIVEWAEGSPTHQLRRRIRQRYRWQAIFRRDIAPLVT